MKKTICQDILEIFAILIVNIDLNNVKTVNTLAKYAIGLASIFISLYPITMEFFHLERVQACTNLFPLSLTLFSKNWLEKLITITCC